MKVLVAGAGNVGRHLASDLADRGHEVTLVEQSPVQIEKARADTPESVNVVLGDACEPWVLEKVGTSEVDVIVAATGDDEDNLVISLLAKQEHAVPRVVARVNHPANEWLFTEQWGVDAAVSPPHILTSLVEEAVTVGDLVRLMRLEGGQVNLVEMTLAPDSPNVGRPLYELRLPLDTAVVAIIREGHVVIPQPETQLAAGDEVMVISSSVGEEELEAAILGVPGSEGPGDRGARALHRAPETPTTEEPQANS